MSGPLDPDAAAPRGPVRRAPPLPTRIGSVWARHVRVYSGTFVSNVTPALLEPLFLLASVGLGLGKFVTVSFNGLPYLEFMSAGTIAMTALYTASFEATYGTYVRMTFQRTYAAMLATPLSPRDVVLGELLFCGTKGLLFATIVAVVLALLGAVSSFGALLVPLAGFVSAVLFAGLGFVVTTVVSNMNHFQFYFTAFLTPLVLFSGLMFPVSEMPAPLAVTAYALPMFHAVETFRWMTSGAEHLSVPWGVWCPLVLLVQTVLCAWWGVRRMERRIAG